MKTYLIKFKLLSLLSSIYLAAFNTAYSQNSEDLPQNMEVFLLFGQSTMFGVPAPESEDLETHPRVWVLGFETCNSRVYNEWALAAPPLHSCWAGVGPGDAFGKIMAEAWPDKNIALVPAALAGANIDLYRKGVVSSRRDDFFIPPDNSSPGAYDMLLAKARFAQQRGTIRGILFHQGESDTADSTWASKVQEIVADLRADLGLGSEVPFLAGELQYDGCCHWHNPIIRQIPDLVPHSYIVSAEGLVPLDSAHFDLPSQREFGRRYAETFLQALENSP